MSRGPSGPRFFYACLPGLPAFDPCNFQSHCTVHASFPAPLAGRLAGCLHHHHGHTNLTSCPMSTLPATTRATGCLLSAVSRQASGLLDGGDPCRTSRFPCAAQGDTLGDTRGRCGNDGPGTRSALTARQKKAALRPLQETQDAGD